MNITFAQIKLCKMHKTPKESSIVGLMHMHTGYVKIILVIMLGHFALKYIILLADCLVDDPFSIGEGRWSEC